MTDNLTQALALCKADPSHIDLSFIISRNSRASLLSTLRKRHGFDLVRSSPAGTWPIYSARSCALPSPCPRRLKGRQPRLPNLDPEFFPSDIKAIAYWRWPPHGQPICPHCGGKEIWRTDSELNPDRFRCRDCRRIFSLLAGTVFQSSKLTFGMIAKAIALLTAADYKSIRGLAAQLNCPYRSTWRLYHRWPGPKPDAQAKEPKLKPPKRVRTGRPPQDIVGLRFGTVIAVRLLGANLHGTAIWTCKCDCGIEKSFPANYLKQRVRFCSRACGMRPVRIRPEKESLWRIARTRPVPQPKPAAVIGEVRETVRQPRVLPTLVPRDAEGALLAQGLKARMQQGPPQAEPAKPFVSIFDRPRPAPTAAGRRTVVEVEDLRGVSRSDRSLTGCSSVF